MSLTFEMAEHELKKKGKGTGVRRDQVLTRIFGQLPFKEAKANLLITPLPQDKGDPFDPFNCRLANACSRMFGCSHALFVGTVAYLDLPDGKGGKVVTRFMLSEEARLAVRRNDGNKNKTVAEIITLRAVPKSQTLAAMRAVIHKQRQTKRKRSPNRYETKPTLVRIAAARTAAGIHTGFSG
jgi:hypothetical protein